MAPPADGDGPEESGDFGDTDSPAGSGAESGVPDEIDPRIQERREQVAQDKSRRRRRRWRRVAVPVVSMAALVGVAHSPPLSVSKVRVEGAAETSEQGVLEAADIDEGRAMMTLDEGATELRVSELPWVEDVDVVRDWPGTVRIKVTERTAVATAVVERTGLAALVDGRGRVLSAVTLADLAATGGVASDGLIVLTGLDALPEPGGEVPTEARAALAIAERAPERVPGMLAEISVDLEAVVAPGVPGEGAVVSFRSGEQVDERLIALDTLLSGADMTCLATVDLWIPDRPVITRRPGC